MPRTIVNADDVAKYVTLPESREYFDIHTKELHATLALPSYVHGYSLAIQYMYNWFESKFPKGFFKGGIYIDGKNVLDDYRRLNDYANRNIVKGQNPRARMAPQVEYDYDRDSIDLYQAPPEVFFRRSPYQDAFFKDYERKLFLGFAPRALRMNVAYKVRLNSRAQQQDVFNRMELYFRNGATQHEYISADFHVPRHIILDIADKAGFDILDGVVIDQLGFLEYLNRHSEVPFLFKLRAISQNPEYFIRVSDIYTHIAVRDKLQLDDGERDGKMDFNFHVEMQATLTIPIPHYYAYYSAEDIMSDTKVEEEENCVALYTINPYEIPKVDEHGWNQAAITDYLTDKGDTEIDFAPIFKGDNSISRVINHDLSRGVSPAHFINIRLIIDDDTAKMPRHRVDWERQVIEFESPVPEEVLHIIIYVDRAYLNEIETEYTNFKNSRITTPTNK